MILLCIVCYISSLQLLSLNKLFAYLLIHHSDVMYFQKVCKYDTDID
jgi:hypothetical protein